MTSTCPSCGGWAAFLNREFDHHPDCPVLRLRTTVTPPVRTISVQPPGSPIPADGALHRCYCGVPIWFEQPPAPRPGMFSYTSSPPCWRETDGTPHRCPKEGHDG